MNICDGDFSSSNSDYMKIIVSGGIRRVSEGKVLGERKYFEDFPR
jgi:hypothetical protein